MVVADQDLEVIRQRIDTTYDLKPAGSAAAGEVLATFEYNDAIRNPMLAGCAERAVERLSLILDRSASDYANAAVTSGGDIAEVTIVGLTSEQHAKGVAFLSACQAYASLFRAATSVRDLGSDESVGKLQLPITLATAEVLPLLKLAAQEFADSLPNSSSAAA